MNARIDSREVTEWLAFEQLYGPLGPERNDHLFAMLQALIANVNRAKGKKAYTPKQFLPGWGRSSDEPEEREVLDGRSLLDKLRGIHRRMGGKEG